MRTAISMLSVLAAAGLLVCSCATTDDADGGMKDGITEDGGEKENLVAFDVTDCVDIHDGGIWSWPWEGDKLRAVGMPDTHSTYWYVALPVLDPERYPGANLELRGRFPNLRFFSFQNSDDESNFIDAIVDYQIAPDPESVQPFRDGIPYPTDGSAVDYTVKVLDVPPEEQVHTPDDNTLFGGYPPTTGELGLYNEIIYRTYLPTDPADRTGSVGLPRIYYVVDLDRAGVETPVTKESICGLFPTENKLSGTNGETLLQINQKADETAPNLAADPNHLVPGYQPPDPIVFVIADEILNTLNLAFPVIPDGILPPSGEDPPAYTNHAQRYLAVFLDPSKQLERLSVIRFKAPSTPTEIIVPGAHQVRYWSVCIMQTLNYAYTWGCGYEEELAQDPDAPGWITIVFSSDSDRPEGLCNVIDPESSTPECSYNWMPYASGAPLIFIRQLVPDSSYREATLFYEGDPLDSAAIREHMGDYYPQAVSCTQARFGLDRCGLAP